MSKKFNWTGEMEKEMRIFLKEQCKDSPSIDAIDAIETRVLENCYLLIIFTIGEIFDEIRTERNPRWRD